MNSVPTVPNMGTRLSRSGQQESFYCKQESIQAIDDDPHHQWCNRKEQLRANLEPLSITDSSKFTHHRPAKLDVVSTRNCGRFGIAIYGLRVAAGTAAVVSYRLHHLQSSDAVLAERGRRLRVSRRSQPEIAPVRTAPRQRSWSVRSRGGLPENYDRIRKSRHV